jgi:hypothetical protein
MREHVLNSSRNVLNISNAIRGSRIAHRNSSEYTLYRH